VTVQFVAGVLVLRLPNAVERHVDSDEFRAAWRTLEADGSPESLRLVTPSGTYLAAVRHEMLRVGASDDLMDPDRTEGESESRLIQLAESRSAEQAGPPSSRTVDNLSVELDAVREERDDLVRERARLEAAISTLQAQVDEEAARADGLAANLEAVEQVAGEAERKAAEAQKAAAGARALAGSIASVIRSELAALHLPEGIGSGLERAVLLTEHDADAGVVQCRKVLEIVAKQAWLRVMATDSVPSFKRFGDLMEDLRDQRDVDRPTWHLVRTLYTTANAAAHQDGATERRWAYAMILCAGHAAHQAESMGKYGLRSNR
jgi:hypothetical protein